MMLQTKPHPETLMSPFLHYVEAAFNQIRTGIEFQIKYIGRSNGYEFARDYMLHETTLRLCDLRDISADATRRIQPGISKAIAIENMEHAKQYTLIANIQKQYHCPSILPIDDQKRARETARTEHNRPTTIHFIDNNIIISFQDQSRQIAIRLQQSDLQKSQIKATAQRIHYAIKVLTKQLVTPQAILDQFEPRRTLAPPGMVKLRFEMPNAFTKDTPNNLAKLGVSLARDYEYSAKLNGRRIWLYIDGKNIYLINRNWLITQYHFGRKLSEKTLKIINSFHECVFDAEQYDGTFYLFDSVFGQTNNDVHELCLADRKTLVRNFCEEVNLPEFQLKPYYSDFGLVTLQIGLEADKNRYDGIIFTPKSSKVIFSLQDGSEESQILQVLKWKQRPTIDLLYLWNNQATMGDLFFEAPPNKNNMEKSTAAQLQSISTTLHLFPHQIVIQDYNLHGRILEVGWDPQYQRFYVIGIRHDKMKPNWVTVVMETWAQIVDPITIENLKCFIDQ